MTTAALAPEEHSDLVGGSSAAKRLACPGSYQMEAKLPKLAKETTSVYAEEGTALHEAMAWILDQDYECAEDCEGLIFNSVTITKDLIDTALKPALGYFDELCERLEPEGGLQFMVEKRCQLPGIPGAFGTSDLIFRTNKRSGILDWKFGSGVPVKALYPDDENGDLLNPQLMFYARAAQHSFPGMFPHPDNTDWPVTLIIVQPRTRGGFVADEVDTDVKELEEFRYALVRAVAEAKGDKPTVRKGEHCRFATCKTICPLWTGPALDLTKAFAAVKQKQAESVVSALAIDWPGFYGMFLEFADDAEEMIAAGRAQAHQFLETGEAIPGWKLVAKRGTEKYTDEKGAVDLAIAKGYKREETLKVETKSPAQLRALIADRMPSKTKKEREEAAKKELSKFTQIVSSGSTLAREDDNRQGLIATSTAVGALAEKLAALNIG